MGRSPCCEKVGLKKGPWTPEEDQKLLAYIEEHGHGSWRALPAKAGLQRCGKSCRLRWTNYLRPDIKRGKFSLQEEQTIIQLHALLGNRWSAIATHLPKRTDNEIKNYWNTHLKKRLTKMGIDPVTHKPKSNALGGSGQSKDAANLSHMAQWESARLEAEARLVRESKLVSNAFQPQLGTTPSAQLLSTAVPPPPPPPPLPPPPTVPPCLDVLKAWQGAWTKTAKCAAFANTIFTSAAGQLESPTSTLNFTETNFSIPNVGFSDNSTLEVINCVENPNACNDGLIKDIQNEWKCSAKSNNSVQFHEMSTYPTDAAAFVADSLRVPNFMEGLTDILLDNTDGHNISNNCGESNDGGHAENVVGSCGGDFEESKMNYWNSILNMINSPPSGSPVF